MKIQVLMLSAGLVAGSPAWALADTTSDLNNQVTTLNNTTANQGQTNVINKISSTFSSFLGADSKAVVTGLRNGTPITLTSTTTTPGSTPGSLPITTPTTTTITPPTGQMGFGNVFISLALAKQELSTLGITQPTPQQLQAALTGGTITQTTGTGTTATMTTTNLQGILALRSQKMGWGQIAQKLGFKLGPVIASLKSANHNLGNTTTSFSHEHGVTNAGGKTHDSDKGIVSGKGKHDSDDGIVSGSGKLHGHDSDHGIVSGNGKLNGHDSDSGIVSGSGKLHGNSNLGIASGKGSGDDGIVSASGRGYGSSYSSGSGRSTIVTGSGHVEGSNSGIVSAQGASGHGAESGKGHDK